MFSSILCWGQKKTPPAIFAEGGEIPRYHLLSLIHISETLEQFQGKLPAELLDFWQEYGFGNYGGGLLKIIDPTDYIDTLTLWLGEQEDCFPILMTGFGTLFIYRKRSETAGDMCLLDIHYRRSGSFSTGFSDFFERILPAENFAEQ